VQQVFWIQLALAMVTFGLELLLVCNSCSTAQYAVTFVVPFVEAKRVTQIFV
jgi:hypothetical protein